MSNKINPFSMLCQGTIINLSCMRLTESILINNWVERMVVGWLEVTTESNLGNCKTNQENFYFCREISLTYGCSKAMLQIKITLVLNTSRVLDQV